MTWDHLRGYRGLEAASAEYARTHGVEIAWDRRSLQAFADAPIASLARAYDFVVLDHPHVGLIAESHCLLPLPMPDDLAKVSLGGSLESYVWRDKLWAYPIDGACQVAVMRPDLCSRPLSDWESLLDGSFSGISVITPLLPIDAFDMMMTLVAGRGEVNLPYAADTFVSNDNGVLALRILKALYKLGPGEAVTWNPVDALEAMATTNEFAYSPCLFGYINYARPGFRDHRLDYVDLPTFRSSALKHGILGGAGIGVSAFGRHQEDAIAFAQWVASEPVQSGIYIENEGQPAHRQTWLNKANDPLYRGFLKGAFDTMDSAWTRPRDPWFLGFVDDVCEIFPAFFLQDRDEDTFLAEINAVYRSHIQRTAAE